MVDFERLIAAIGRLEVVIRNNQAKIEAEIKIIQDGQEEMNVQVGSLASRIDANHEEKKEEIKSDQAEMKARFSAILQKYWREETKTYLEKMGANPKEMKPLARN
jgi:hypothetical protein